MPQQREQEALLAPEQRKERRRREVPQGCQNGVQRRWPHASLALQLGIFGDREQPWKEVKETLLYITQ